VANADEEVGGGEGAEYFVRNLPFPIGAAYGMNEGGVGVTDIFGGGGKFFLLNMWEKGPVWMKLSAAGGRARQPPVGEGRPGAACAGDGARGRTSGPGAADGTGPGHAAGAAREGILDLDVDALRGGTEEEAALEALGRRFPEIDPLLRNTFAVTTLAPGSSRT